jgi:hypothetical protein
MELNNPPDKYRLLWEAAIREAAGPLSAYITPEDYGLSTVQLSAYSSESKLFEQEIRARIDFGRATMCLKLLEEFDAHSNRSYKHDIVISKDRIKGNVYVPRLVMLRANGEKRLVPTLQATQHLVTPENLLASELFQLSLKIFRFWGARGGAEARLAKTQMVSLQRLEARTPWSDLRAKPRPPLRELAGLVKSRTRAGWHSPHSAPHRMAELAISEGGSSFVHDASGPLSFLGVQDERFADRLFELLCLGWCTQSLQQSLDQFKVNADGIRNSHVPLMTGVFQGAKIEVFYQMRFSSTNHWVWSHSGKQLQGIPDLVIRSSKDEKIRHLLVDAKNRVSSAEGEVAYKLLGYKENLRLSPYLAVALFPEFGNVASVKGLSADDSRVVLARIPLESGPNGLADIARSILAQLQQEP